MATSVEDIRAWLLRGVEQKSTHVIIAVDTWDYEDYPVYVSATENVHEKVNSYNSKEDRIKEVYSLAMDLEEQLLQRRVWNV